MAQLVLRITGYGLLLLLLGCCWWSHVGQAATVPASAGTTADEGATTSPINDGTTDGRTEDETTGLLDGKLGKGGGKIVCYYSSWSGYRPGHGSYSVDDIPLHLCTHVVYAFIGLNNRTWELLVLDPTNDITRGGYRRFTSLKKKNPSLKTLISVGGWVEGGRKYSEMTSLPERRRVFVNSVVDFLKWFNFDGIDLDWEFPGSADRDGSAADKQNFVLLVQELREAFEKEGWGWLITAVAPIMKFRVESGYDVEKLTANLDHINLLTYDLRGNWTGFTDIHTPLRPRAFDHGDYEGVNMHDGAELWQRKGASASKLMIGLAMYGRTYTLADPAVNGLRAPLSGRQTAGRPGPYTKANGTLAYYEICELQKEGGWNQKYDPIGDSVYMTKGDQWIGFDDRQSLVEKVKFVQERGYGGVAIWSLDLDDFRGVCGEKRILMNSIYKQMYGRPAYTAGPSFPKTSLITASPNSHGNAIGSSLNDVTPRSPLADPSGATFFDTTTPSSLSFATASQHHDHLLPSTQHHFRSTVPPTFHASAAVTAAPPAAGAIAPAVIVSGTAAPPTSGFFEPAATTWRTTLDLNPNLLLQQQHEPVSTTEPSPDALFDGHRISVPDDAVASRNSQPGEQSSTVSGWSIGDADDGQSSERATVAQVEDHTSGQRERNHFPTTEHDSTSDNEGDLTERNEVELASTSAPTAATTNAGQLDDLGLAGIFANNDDIAPSNAAAALEPLPAAKEVVVDVPAATQTTPTSTTPAPATSPAPITTVTEPSSTKRSVIVTRPPIRRKPGTRGFARPPKSSTSEPSSNSVTSSTGTGTSASVSANKIRTKPFRLGGSTGNRRPPLRRRTTTTSTSTAAPSVGNSESASSSSIRSTVQKPSANDVTDNSDQLQTSASRTAPPVRRFLPGRRLKIKSTTELFTELATGQSSTTTSRRTAHKSTSAASSDDSTADWDTSESSAASSDSIRTQLPNRGSSRFQNPGSLLTSRPQDDEPTAAPIAVRNRVRVRPSGLLPRNRHNQLPTTTAAASSSATTSQQSDSATLQSGSSNYKQIFVRFAPTPAVRLIRQYAIRPRQLPRSVPTGGSPVNRVRGGAAKNEESDWSSVDLPASVDPSAPACPLTSRAYAAHRLCDHYWWCVHGRAVLKTCEMGLLWNPEKSSCDWASDIVRDDCE